MNVPNHLRVLDDAEELEVTVDSGKFQKPDNRANQIANDLEEIPPELEGAEGAVSMATTTVFCSSICLYVQIT